MVIQFSWLILVLKVIAWHSYDRDVYIKIMMPWQIVIRFKLDKHVFANAIKPTNADTKNKDLKLIPIFRSVEIAFFLNLLIFAWECSPKFFSNVKRISVI